MENQSLFNNMNRLSTEDQKKISRFGRGPTFTAPYSTVHGAFEHIVDTYPSNIAAVHGDQKITYHQLDLAANRLANYLIDSGLRPKNRVCIVVQRSLEMLIGIFAVMKAGCQYVPIDGGVASEKALQHIFEDTEAQFILCLPKYWDKARQFARRDAIIIALDMNTGAFYSHQRPEIPVTSEDGVYAMYTSGKHVLPILIRLLIQFQGSTGVPKGVDVKHGTKTNALLSEPGRLGITVGSKVAQVLSISFAMGKLFPEQCMGMTHKTGAWEMLGCLMNGGTLYLRGSDWLATLEEVSLSALCPLSANQHNC
jgi:non-ribosomal peptide synthetase component F